MLDLGMQLVKGDRSDAMRAARLTALLEGVPDDVYLDYTYYINTTSTLDGTLWEMSLLPHMWPTPSA